MRKQRNTVAVVLFALLAVVGLGLTAATITSTYASDIVAGQGPGDQTGSESGNGNIDPSDSGSDVVGEPGSQQQPLEVPDICIEILTTVPATLGLIVGFIVLVALAYRQRGFIAAGFVGYLLGIPLVLGYGLVTQCGTDAVTGGEEGGIPVLSSLSNVADSAAGTTVPPIVFAGVFAVAAIIAIGIIASAAGSREVEPEEWEDEEEPGLEEFAAVAGEAADRIESTDASVDNTVYRAWVDMTSLLDISNPETHTAGEFADAAVDAGLEEEDVSNLTRLFEEVRYGDMDPQPREELAIETLRSIEETYGGDTTDDDTGSTGSETDETGGSDT